MSRLVLERCCKTGSERFGLAMPVGPKGALATPPGLSVRLRTLTLTPP